MKNLIYLFIALIVVGSMGCCDCENGKKCRKNSECVQVDSLMQERIRVAIAETEELENDDLAQKARHKNFGDGFAVGDVNVAISADVVNNSLMFRVVEIKSISDVNARKMVDTLEVFDLSSSTIGIWMGEKNQVLVVDDYRPNSLKWKTVDSLKITDADFDVKVIPSYAGLKSPAFIGNQDARDYSATGKSSSLLVDLDYEPVLRKRMRLWYNKNTKHLLVSVNAETKVLKPKLHPGYVGKICYGTTFNAACYN